MKDKRIWIVIGCILVIGTGVTHYTKYYVGSQATVTEQAAAAAGEAAAPVPAPASAPEVQKEEMDGQIPAEASVPPGRSLSAALPEPETAAAPSAAEAGTAPAEMPDTEAAEADAAQIYTEDEIPVEAVPISPLTGARSGAEKTTLVVDYRQRLVDLDTQIQKMRDQETDSNVYSIKTSAETELKMWEGELNTIYSALLELLSPEDAAKLASEQQEWLKSRDARAAGTSGRSGNSVESIGYAATLVSITRDRAYELSERYEEANGLQPPPGEEGTTSVSGQ